MKKLRIPLFIVVLIFIISSSTSSSYATYQAGKHTRSRSWSNIAEGKKPKQVRAMSWAGIVSEDLKTQPNTAFLPLSKPPEQPKTSPVNTESKTQSDADASVGPIADLILQEKFHIAVKKGKTKEAIDMLKDYKSLMTPSGLSGFGALALAATHNKLDTMKSLIGLGAKVNEYDYTKRTALHWVFLAKDEEKPEDEITEYDVFLMVKLLLNSGADVNLPDVEGKTALHWAAFNGYFEIVEFLIANGADVGAVNQYNETPLFLAAFQGNLKIVKTLLEYKEKSGLHTRNKLGFKPLHLAARGGHLEVFKHLHSLLQAWELDIELPTYEGQTYLFLAVLSQNYELVKYLFSLNADVNITSGEGQSPLHVAANYGNLEISKLLVEKMEAKNMSVNVRRKSGKTPLYETCFGTPESENGRAAVADFLLSKGAINLFPAFQVVCSTGSLPLVKVFTAEAIKRKHNINLPGKLGLSGLHQAVLGNHLEVVKHLVGKGANVQLRTSRDRTPLQLAKSRKFKDLQQYLERVSSER